MLLLLTVYFSRSVLSSENIHCMGAHWSHLWGCKAVTAQHLMTALPFLWCQGKVLSHIRDGNAKDRTISANLCDWCSPHCVRFFRANWKAGWGWFASVYPPWSYRSSAWLQVCLQGFVWENKSWWKWFNPVQKGNPWQRLESSCQGRDTLLISHLVYKTPFDFCSQGPGNPAG